MGEGDGLHEASEYLLAQYDKFRRWLDAEDPDLAANALLLLIGRTLNMLGRQKEAQGEAFRQEGGFRERLEAGAPRNPRAGAAIGSQARVPRVDELDARPDPGRAAPVEQAAAAADARHAVIAPRHRQVVNSYFPAGVPPP